MDLASSRHAIAHLLNDSTPLDAIERYYAFNHPDHRTHIVTAPEDSLVADSFVTLSRTGNDLFRPYVTLRLPPRDPNRAVQLLYEALPAGAPLLLQANDADSPLLRAVFDINHEEQLRLLTYVPSNAPPEINVLVSASASNNGLPRFVIRQPGPDGDSMIVASAGLNWQSNTFAELTVFTHPSYQRRGFGRSVVVAVANAVVAAGRTPLYLVAEHNSASIRTAEAAGFVDTGLRKWLLDGSRKENLPAGFTTR